MADPNGSDRAPRGGGVTLLWVGALVLSLGATAILVITDDPRLLRVGLVVALWAAFLGAFGVLRLRHRVADDDDRAEQRQRVYELELEREVAARREFELEAENEARRRAAEESGNDIEALRAELRTLREVLEPLLGGDVLYERVALQAESTRVRALADQRSPGSGEQPPASGSAVRAAGVNGDQTGSVGAVRAAAGDLLHRPEREYNARPNRARPAAQGREQGPARQGGTSSEPSVEPAGSQPPRSDPSEPSRNSGSPGPARPAPPRSAPNGHQHPAARQASPATAPGRPATTSATASRPDIAPAFAQGRTPSRSDLPRPGSQSSQQGSVPDPEPNSHPDPSAEPSGSGHTPTRDGDENRDASTSSWTSQVSPGAHAEGTSVVDLLAAYGDSGDSRRRRRRGE